MLIRRLTIFAWHCLGLYFAFWFAFALRFDGTVPLQAEVILWNTLPLLLVISLPMFGLFRLYSGMWSFFSVDDLARMGIALAASTAAFAGAVFAVQGMTFEGFPRSVFITHFLMMGIWMGGGRFVARYVREWMHGDRMETGGTGGDRILLVGRLHDADLLLRAARHGNVGKILGVLTDETVQPNLTFHGVPVLGAPRDIADTALRIRANCAIVLPPFNRPRQMNELVDACSRAKVVCKFRTVPSLADLAAGDLAASSIRNVDIEDLIERPQTRLDHSETRAFIKNRKILVTGAGGTVGSELCRQIAGYEPAALVVFELNEFALYSIDMELRAKYPNMKILAIAGDIRHPEEISTAIDACGGIDVIYHAAAYKHVPLMEQNVPAAFRTNVLGTHRLAEVAVAKKVDKVVMISSDKAVRPSSIMGATKRLAERLITERDPGDTTFVSVRFGNVLESSGSVIPLFKRQVAVGGPVTVTSPEVRRFFMTISEAVDLVLLAGAVGRNGEILVLEMGESIKIVDLATRLIELSGLTPGKDIEIRFVGMRPGEKEVEEVMTADENVVRTAHEKIWVFMKKDGLHSGKPDVDKIARLVAANDTSALRRIAAEYIPDNQFHA